MLISPSISSQVIFHGFPVGSQCALLLALVSLVPSMLCKIVSFHVIMFHFTLIPYTNNLSLLLPLWVSDIIVIVIVTVIVTVIVSVIVTVTVTVVVIVVVTVIVIVVAIVIVSLSLFSQLHLFNFNERCSVISLITHRNDSKRLTLCSP